MALTPGGRAPYTTASAAITALDAWRNRGLGIPINVTVLTRADVPESIAPRTLRSFTELELVDENGQPTSTLAAFKEARRDEEYRSALQGWLRTLYADVLTYADPSTDTLDRVQEAFHTYEPAGQRKAMAGLLVGLWRYAGFPTTGPEGGTLPPTRPPRPRTRPSSRKASRGTDAPGLQTTHSLPASLLGILRDMPEPGSTWTSHSRSAFLRAFTATVDFLIRVDDTEDEDLDAVDRGGAR